MPHRIALFGEAEKGNFHLPYFCQNLYDLSKNLGNPPEESLGLYFAVQALLYDREIIFFRVQEEGFNIQDYILGSEFLKNKDKVNHLEAICIPGVGDHEILQPIDLISKIYKSLIITTEKDLFDYLLSR